MQETADAGSMGHEAAGDEAGTVMGEVKEGLPGLWSIGPSTRRPPGVYNYVYQGRVVMPQCHLL